jgi:hypothetical protein
MTWDYHATATAQEFNALTQGGTSQILQYEPRLVRDGERITKTKDNIYYLQAHETRLPTLKFTNFYSLPSSINWSLQSIEYLFARAR